MDLRRGFFIWKPPIVLHLDIAPHFLDDGLRLDDIIHGALVDVDLGGGATTTDLAGSAPQRKTTTRGGRDSGEASVGGVEEVDPGEE